MISRFRSELIIFFSILLMFCLCFSFCRCRCFVVFCCFLLSLDMSVTNLLSIHMTTACSCHGPSRDMWRQPHSMIAAASSASSSRPILRRPASFSGTLRCTNCTLSLVSISLFFASLFFLSLWPVDIVIIFRFVSRLDLADTS